MRFDCSIKFAWRGLNTRPLSQLPLQGSCSEELECGEDLNWQWLSDHLCNLEPVQRRVEGSFWIVWIDWEACHHSGSEGQRDPWKHAPSELYCWQCPLVEPKLPLLRNYARLYSAMYGAHIILYTLPNLELITLDLFFINILIWHDFALGENGSAIHFMCVMEVCAPRNRAVTDVY